MNNVPVYIMELRILPSSHQGKPLIPPFVWRWALTSLQQTIVSDLLFWKLGVLYGIKLLSYNIFIILKHSNFYIFSKKVLFNYQPFIRLCLVQFLSLDLIENQCGRLLSLNSLELLS